MTGVQTCALPIYNFIGNKGTRSITEALCHNTCWTTLGLSFNSIGDEGARSMGDALCHNTCLTTLNLSHNYISVEGARSLAEALYHNTCLTTLDLSGDSIGIGEKMDVIRIGKECREQVNQDHLSILLGTRDPTVPIYQFSRNAHILSKILQLATVPNCEIKIMLI